LQRTNQADLDFISSLIGKPARDVTQVDIDFVADLIAQQEVITDLNMSQRQYDVTGDGLINQDDFALLEQALAGTDVTFAPGSIFGPATGLYAQNQAALDAQLAAEAETQAASSTQQTQNQTRARYATADANCRPKTRCGAASERLETLYSSSKTCMGSVWTSARLTQCGLTTSTTSKAYSLRRSRLRYSPAPMQRVDK
jgi:hypothetical protein